MQYTAQTYSESRQQIAILAAAMFGSIVAAVLVSTFIIMSLMQGQMASALNAYTKNEAPSTVQAASTGVCSVAPESASAPDEQAAVWVGNGGSGGGAVHVSAAKKPLALASWSGGISGSFNSTNTSHTSVSNTTHNTETNNYTKTIVNDSFNKGSFNNPVDNSNNSVNVSDVNVAINSGNGNTVASNNTVASGNGSGNSSTATNNTTTNTTTNNTNNTTTNTAVVTNSNNVVETHVLSDNTAVIVPVVPILP
jgi:hypothetical protein